MIKELFKIRNLFPGLSLYGHLIFYRDQVQRSITIRVEVSHIFTVNLKRRNLNRELLVPLFTQSLELFKNERSCSREDTTQLIYTGFHLIKEENIWWAFHSESLSCSSLTIGENANSEAVKGTSHNVFDFIKNIFLCTLMIKDLIKFELVGLNLGL